MDKKEITFLALHLNYGGIERFIVNTANLLCGEYKVRIIATYKLLPEPAFSLNDEVKVDYLLPDRAPNSQAFKAAIKEKNPIKILGEGFKAMKTLYLRKKVMKEAIKGLTSEVVISTRDFHNALLGKYGKKDCVKIATEHNHHDGDEAYINTLIKSCKAMDYFVVPSIELKEFYEKAFEKNHNETISSICIPHFLEHLPEKGATLKEKNMVAVGRLSKEKGFVDLIHVFAQVVQSHPDWHLDIIGEGDERKAIEFAIEQCGLAEKVTLHGFKNTEAINKFLEKSSLYLMTSFKESFGIVLIEAMAYGLPCIAFDSAQGAREIIDSGETGYLVPNRDVTLMVEKIKMVIDDETLRMRMGKAGKEKSNLYSGEKIKGSWYNLMDTAIESKEREKK